MNCTSCGSPTRAGAAFCGSCGARLDVPLITGPVAEFAAATTMAPPLPPPPPTLQAPAGGPLLPPPPPPPLAPSLPPAAAAPVASVGERPAEVSPAAVAATPSPGGMIAPPPGVSAPVVNAAPTAVAPPIATTRVDDALDDRTRVAPPRRSRAGWRLVLPDGTAHALTGTTVLGRQPDAKVAPGATAVLKIIDPDGLVSKSHAVLELDQGRLAVRDLGSTNGVVALSADGSETEVSTVVGAALDEGSEIELGSYVIRIERA